jgi:hypothetical protein
MHKQILHHATSFRRRTLVVAMALTASLGILSVASPALAAPTGEFAVFSQCPLSNPSVKRCIFAETKSGEVKIGSTAVPIKKPIILQGGTYTPAGSENEVFVGAANGETLSKTPQTVPGGLLDLIRCEEIKGEGFLEKGARKACEAVFENKLTGVTATTELVGPVSINEANLALGEGIALTLPVRIHLNNPFLGNACYIGSSSNPVTLNLTTGTTSPPPPNKPISGSPGETEFRAGGKILVINNNSLVDNSFSVPVATGCGPLPLSEYIVDPIVDAKLGLPSAAGKNTAILNGFLEQTTKKAVEESE